MNPLLLWIVGGLGCALVLAKLWQAGNPGQPTQVKAQLVETDQGTSVQVTEVQLMTTLMQLTTDKGRDRALQREAERLIEQEASKIVLPWASPKPAEAPKG